MDNAQKMKSFLSKRGVIIILILILILGFTLRIYGLGVPSLWVDESISSIAAQKIAEKGVPIFDSGLFYGRALIFHYLLAPLTSIFHNDFGIRLISVFFGLGTIILAFYIGNSYNKQAGLIAALFTAVLFLEVAYSRQARFYQMFQFFFFLTLFFLYKSKKSKKYAWLSGISFLILVDTHIAGIIIAPVIFYLFVKEKKGWKFFIIPVLVTVYSLPAVLGISSGVTGLATNYLENYSSSLFFYLRAFAIISLFGLPFAFKQNRRLTLLLIIPSIILIISVFFLKVFALRYVYFIVLLVPLFIGVIFSFIHKNHKILFIILLIFAVVYPSNLFFSYNSLTVIKPEIVQINTVSEPILDYKDLSSETQTKILNSQSVVLFTPSFAWYLKSPDYFIPFSLNGLDSGYALHDGKDSYTGALQFNFTNPQVKEFILVEDVFGYSKLTNERRKQLNLLKGKCELLEKTDLVKIYRCELPN